MPRHRSTQADVAAVAGVSQTTVSFVLNGSAPKGVHISEDTRRRVLDAIQITGYSANPVAQRLAGGRNQILGFFTYEPTFPRGGGDFYRPFLVGVEQAAEQLGVDMLLFTSARVIDGRRQLSRDGWQRLGIADGCLLLGQHEDQSELQHLLDTSYPFVFIGKRASAGGRLPYVGADYASATARQVARLVERGHRRIGYAGPQSGDQPTLDRVAGYRSAMEEHGLTPRFIDMQHVGRAADEIIERDLTGVVVASEQQPEGLAAELGSRGLGVPGDVSLLLLGQPVHPTPHARAWSGFAVPREEMGARALVLLSRIVDQESGPARTAGRRTPAAPQLTDDDYHQMLDCIDVDGDSLAAAAHRDEKQGTVRDHA